MEHEQLRKDEIYQQFVQEIASEFRFDAFQAFFLAGCDNKHKEHFIDDLSKAMVAHERVCNEYKS